MKNHKLVLSLDIQDEEGKSLIDKTFANALRVKLSQEEAVNFNLQFGRILLERFVNHLYVECLAGHRENTPLPALQIMSNKCEIKWQRSPEVERDYSHSEVKVTGKGNPYTYLPAGIIQCDDFPQGNESEKDI